MGEAISLRDGREDKLRGRLIISHVTSGTNAHMRGHVSEDAFGWPVLLSSALAGNKTLPVFVRVGLCVWFFFAFAYFSLRDSAVAMQSRSRREEEGDEEKGGNQSLFFLSLSLSLSLMTEHIHSAPPQAKCSTHSLNIHHSQARTYAHTPAQKRRLGTCAVWAFICSPTVTATLYKEQLCCFHLLHWFVCA